jgi:hypothetical protein
MHLLNLFFKMFFLPNILMGNVCMITYWVTTADQIKIAWEVNDDYQEGDLFEILLEWVETKHVFNLGTTSDLTFTFYPPRVGHFDVNVRSTRHVDDETILHSAWIVSTNSETSKVDGENQGWRFYAVMPPTGPIVID